jgi:uncharacterized protein (UPF0548 family)
MFLLHEPTESAIRRFLESQEGHSFSYPEVGASRERPPRGYTVDHNRIRLGRGAEVFTRAIEAVKRWEMFNLSWIRLCWPDAPIECNTLVAVVARHFGFYTMNACRVIYVVDEDGPIRRYGFGYGTLPDHVETGEERFTVEWDRAGDWVSYDILAFSRANHFLSRTGYPVTRLLQKRFAEDSKRAMARAVEGDLR